MRLLQFRQVRLCSWKPFKLQINSFWSFSVCRWLKNQTLHQLFLVSYSPLWYVRSTGFRASCPSHSCRYLELSNVAILWNYSTCDMNIQLIISTLFYPFIYFSTFTFQAWFFPVFFQLICHRCSWLVCFANPIESVISKKLTDKSLNQLDFKGSICSVKSIRSYWQRSH